MKTMVATAKAFRTWKMVLEATDRLPEGRAQVTLGDRRLWKRVKSPSSRSTSRFRVAGMSWRRR